MKKILLFSFLALQLFTAQTLDLTFAGTGTSVLNTPNTGDNAINLFTNPDHSIVTLASPGIGQGGIGFTTYRMIYKTDANGIINQNFGVGGGNPTSITVRQDQILKLADGKFVTMGNNYGLILQKFNQNGTPDISFGNNGTLNGISMNYGTISGYYMPNDIVELNDGKLLIIGLAVDSDNKRRTVLMRVNSNGTLDTSFGNGGRYFVKLNSVDTGSVGHNLFKSNNKIIITGADDITEDAPSRSFYVARINLDGTFDNTFGVNGRIIKTFTGDYTRYVQAVKDVSDNIYIGGYCNRLPTGTGTYSRILKITGSGNIDSSFGTNGVATYSFLNISGYTDEIMKSMALGSNGIYFGGYIFEIGFYYPEFASGFLAKFNLDGTPNLSFGNNGMYNFFAPGQLMRRVNKIKFDDLNRLIVAGDSKYVDRQFTLVRFNINGETLGINNEAKISNDFQIYPNPASDFIKIKQPKVHLENITYVITDISGRIIQSGNYNNELINIKKITSGIYFFKLFSTGKNNIFSKKFIKN